MAMKCFHHNDLDGRCSGAVVHKFLQNTETDYGDRYEEIDYKDRFPIEIIRPDELVYIVDYSLNPEVMEELLKITQNIVWIDHHKTNDYQYLQPIKGLRITEDKKYAACELVWQYCFPDEPIPLAIRLIGDYDKWALKMPESEYFNLGMKLHPHYPKDSIWKQLFESNDLVEAIAGDGKLCADFRDNFCLDYAKSYGWEAEFEGYKCFLMGIYMFGSKTFGEKFKQYPICISYEFLGNKWIVGLYSETVDVGLIAKKYGGGGHKGAAGFVCSKLPFIKGNND